MAAIEPRPFQEWINIQLELWKQLYPNINLNTDSMVYADSASVAALAYLLQAEIVVAANNAFIAYATGDELTNLGLDRGIPRKEATEATGEVTFGRTSLASSNFVIPAGTEVGTQISANGTRLVYRTDAAVTLYGSVTDPSAAAVTTANAAGGTIPDSTAMNYVVTALDGNGIETLPSPVSTVTTGTPGNTSSVTVSWAAVPLATGYKVYASQGGSTTYEFMGQTTVTTFTDISGIPLSTDVPPATNETGMTEVNANITAVATGNSYNVGAFTITELVTSVLGIEYVNNLLPVSGGADEESDNEYRARIRDILMNSAAVGTQPGYKRIAESVAGVASATVVQPFPGTIDRNIIHVYVIADNATGLPSAALLAAVQAELDKDENHAIADEIYVLSPVAQPINVDVQILTYDSVNYVFSDIQSDIINRLTAFLRALDVGATVYAVDIENVIHDTAGVIDFTMTNPTANVSLPAATMAIPGTFNIT